MKRGCVLGLIIFIALTITFQTVKSYGAESAYLKSVGNKAARGVKNILFGWTELPKRIVDITKETKNPIWGLLAGTFQGSLKCLARTASGVSDVVTAPVTPEKDPLIQADIDVE